MTDDNRYQEHLGRLTSLCYEAAPGIRRLAAVMCLLPLIWAVGGCREGSGSGSSAPEDDSSAIPEDFRMALSISPFSSALLDAGWSFSADGQNASDLYALQELYVDHYATEVYVRVSTRDEAHEHGVDRSLSAGMQHLTVANTLSLPLNVELGLFRSYGDILCQTPPDFSDYPDIEPSAEWHELELSEMEALLEAYGAHVASEILATGVTVNYWNLGNEIDFGTAGVAPAPAPEACDGDEGEPGWYEAPDAVNPEIGNHSVVGLLVSAEEGRIAWLEEHVWPYAAPLLEATAQGIRSVDPNARFATHISTSYAPDFAEAFYQAMHDHGFQPDQLGLSLYPSAHEDATARMQAFRDTVGRLQDAFDKPVFIAEFAYPAGAVEDGPFSDWDNLVDGYPFTESGQADLARDLGRWAAANDVAGIRPWGADLVIGGWEQFALFEAAGGNEATARAALEALADGLKEPDAEALP